MNIQRIVRIALLLSLSSLAAHQEAGAANPALAEIRLALAQHRSTLRSLSGTFEQGRLDPMFAQPVFAEGKLWMRRSLETAGKEEGFAGWDVRLELQKPERLTVVIQSQTVQLQRGSEPKTAQATKMPLPVADHLPMSWVLSPQSGSLPDERLQLADASEIASLLNRIPKASLKAAGLWLTFRDPKMTATEICSLRLDASTLLPDVFVWQDRLGLLHWVKMKKMRLNQEFPEELFSLQAR